MNMLLAFSPFLGFVTLNHIFGAEVGLLGAMIIALLMLITETAIRHKSPKLLEIGTVILFGLLALYGWAGGAAWSLAGIRLTVDAGLLVIVLVSIVIGQPFTLQYARESVPDSFWKKPEFIRTNLVITAVWAAAFAVITAIDLAWLLKPSLPQRVVIIVTVLALFAAAKFTGFYPDRKPVASVDTAA